MTKVWNNWEGRLVDGVFELRQYMGGSDHSAVFLTGFGGGDRDQAAIKLIAAKSENPELQLSWWELAAKLSHPHLIRIFKMGRCELEGTELLYMVMEYAEESLSQILPSRPLTTAETRHMLQPLLSSLAYIHGKGFVHGHLKPANILAVGDELKLSSDSLCGVGEPSKRVLGTSSLYDSPEIASGLAISPASDVWSLGMTLVEVLTQRLPVWNPAGPGEPLLPERLPEPFREISLHCLRRDPAMRWTTSNISQHLQLTSPTAPRAAAPMPAVNTARYAVPAAVAGLVLLAIIAVPRLLHHAPNAPQDSSATIEPLSAPPKPEAGRVAAEAVSNSGSEPTGRNTATVPGGDGAILHRVVPDVPKSARNTIHGTIKVKVRVAVDSSGNVTRATFDSAGPSKYFARLAMQAAQQWTFARAQNGDQDLRHWVLRFEFTRGGVNAFPGQESR